MNIELSNKKKHLYSKCTIIGIASDYPKNNWYKIFYKILDLERVHVIAELKEDVKIFN